MNKNLHDIDKLFYEALEGNAEMPSAAAREKLIAALDKKDAESTRKGLIWWRRTALLLIVLLAGFVLFDTGILQTGNGPGNKKPVSEKSISVAKKNNKQEILIPRGQINNEPGIDNTAGIIRSKELPQFLNHPSSLYFSNTASTIISKSKESNSFLSTADPENYMEYAASETTKQLPWPISLTDRTSKRIPMLQHVPMAFAPRIVSKKPPGNIFRPYWQLGIFSSYEQVGYRLDSDDQTAISNIKHSEVHEPSFSGGILATRYFNKHWGVQTGLIYSYTAIGISPQKIYAFQDPVGDIAYKYVTSSGYTYIKPSFGPPPTFGDSLIAESKHTLQSLHIPVMAIYKLGKNKLIVSPAAGIDAGFITSARAEVELTDASNHERAIINKLTGTRKIYWSAAASVDIQYKLTKKTSLSLQPVYRHALSPITENNVVETFPRSLGLRVGLAIKL